MSLYNGEMVSPLGLSPILWIKFRMKGERRAGAIKLSGRGDERRATHVGIY